MTESVFVNAQCPQNNFTVSGFQLRNQNGIPFSVTDDYELGEPINGELWVMLGGSSTNGYNMRFFFDVFINGVITQNDQYECLFSGVQAQQNVWVFVRDFTWNWGDVVDIKDIFIHWDTGTAKAGTSCTVSDKNNINSQCYGNLNGYTAAVPLFPKFDFASNGICNTTIQFTSQTIGGTPPFNYAYSWDFNQDGIIDSNSANPVYSFPSAGTYPIALTVNDGTSNTTITKDIFIDPNFGIQVDIFPTKINDESGIIYIQSVTGGTPPYSFFWTGPNGFTSTDEDIFNLADGLYQLVVTDSNGCQQIEQYIMDIASLLNLDWKSFDAKLIEEKVKITWKMNFEVLDVEYYVQRSFRDLSNFESITRLKSKSASHTSVVYEFEDRTVPRFEERIYYRVEKRKGNLSTFSDVKLIQQTEHPDRDAWLVYPNPSSGGFFNLSVQKDRSSFERMITIDLFDSSNFFKKTSLHVKPGQTIQLAELFGTLPKGILFLRIQDEKELKLIKLINGN